MFPGYVLIHMVMNDDTWYVVRNTRGVTGFVGPGSKPVPLTEDRDETIGESDRQKQYRCTISTVGDNVAVTGRCLGKIQSGVDSDAMNVRQAESSRSMYELFGRETPVEINVSDIKKMD